tara:strand:+ start:270 stop:455 length:186 start_codon:yes stop_codon:yes gene_type:complete
MESEDHKLFSKPAYQWYVVVLLTKAPAVAGIDLAAGLGRFGAELGKRALRDIERTTYQQPT